MQPTGSFSPCALFFRRQFGHTLFLLVWQAGVDTLRVLTVILG